MATLWQLKTFIAVAEYKKMSAAAKKLFISQPTVSQIISSLEEEYQVTLFERKPKELQITHAGRILLESAMEIISINERMEQNLHNLHAKRPLRAGATLTIGNTLMSSLVYSMKKTYPDIDVSVFVDNTRILEHRLIHNELDIALVEGIILREEIITEAFVSDSLKLICGPEHPFWGKSSVTMDELSDQRFVMREKGSGTRAIFENIMVRNHIPFTTVWECSSGTAIIDAVRHSLGLGVLSERCIREAVAKKELHEFTVEGVSLKRSFYICYCKNHFFSSQMEDFITAAKSIPEGGK
ncbi:MAG: LysR family transcriptional regulator [Eubacteriales bacterium]|nr:LysR family transcriptional regulator [Eubacteriales bacterium]